jgi:hypothetical protein
MQPLATIMLGRSKPSASLICGQSNATKIRFPGWFATFDDRYLSYANEAASQLQKITSGRRFSFANEKL